MRRSPFPCGSGTALPANKIMDPFKFPSASCRDGLAHRKGARTFTPPLSVRSFTFTHLPPVSVHIREGTIHVQKCNARMVNKYGEGQRRGLQLGRGLRELRLRHPLRLSYGLTIKKVVGPGGYIPAPAHGGTRSGGNRGPRQRGAFRSCAPGGIPDPRTPAPYHKFFLALRTPIWHPRPKKVLIPPFPIHWAG